MIKRRKKKQHQIEEDAQERAKLQLFFGLCWLGWDRRSDISGVYVGNDFGTSYFHHILGKKAHPKLKFCKDNIIRITMDEHTNVEANINYYEIINKKRDELMNNYEKYVILAEQFENDTLNPLLINAKGRLW